jgi:hypothetical protein
MRHLRAIRRLKLFGLVYAAVLLLAAACGTEPEGPDLAGLSTSSAHAIISDGRFAGGTNGFWFLPPVLPQPTGTGTFESMLTPTVEIVELDASGVPGAVIRSFTGSAVQVDPVAETYKVNWHSHADNLDPTKTYRIQVSAVGLPLGLSTWM